MQTSPSSAAFDKSPERFPVKNDFLYLNNCGIAPQYSGAVAASAEWQQTHGRRGAFVMAELGAGLAAEFRGELGRFLQTAPENLSYVRNTAEALSMIANGLPLEPGDRIVSYVHEYPSNHYPWLLQQRNRGAELALIPDADPTQNSRMSGPDFQHKPRGFLLEDLAERIDERTRVVALSHVQFTSGFAVDLQRLGAICRERGVWLIIDAAQSLGSLPLKPEEWGVDAIAASGWKWLLGPVGTGVLYTSSRLRERLRIQMAGPELMRQGDDYLNHDWNPHGDGRMFEYSTPEPAGCRALTACLRDLFNHYGMEAIAAENERLRKRLLERLDRERYQALEFAPENQSGILSFLTPQDDPAALAKRALGRGVFVGSRGGYFRTGVHFYLDDAEIDRAAEVLNNL